MIEPITQDELERFDNYLPEELEKNIYRNKQNNISDEVNGIKLYQVLGNNFNKKTYEPSIKQDTGFNLTTLNSISGEIKGIECKKPTVLFAQKGDWKIVIGNSNIKLEKGDTFSVPLSSKIDISCNNSENSILNFVSQI